jgi:hypothetical protein
LARLILLVILFLVIARTLWRFIDAILRAAGAAPSAQSGQRSGPQSAVKMSQCPVCGTYVVPGKSISIVNAGSTVYFDTEKCRAEYQSR